MKPQRPNQRPTITGLFRSESEAAAALIAAKDTLWDITDVRGPIPGEQILSALGPKKSGVGWFTLAGGILGFLTGYLLAAFTAARWGLMVSGKPIIAYVPFFIVGFEFTILFSVFGNVVGMILMMKLPAYTDLENHRPEFTGDAYGVMLTCGPGQEQDVKSFLTNQGAEIV